MIAKTQVVESFGLVVRDKNGRIKNTRFIKHGWEFVPNKIYLKCVNAGLWEPNSFMVPFVLGSWKRIKK